MNLKITPNATRAALWVGLAFAVIILINYAVKTINRLKSNATNNAANSVNQGSLTFDLKQYQIFADKLEQSIGSLTTDESAVYTVFKKMKTNDDVKQLILTFGERTFTYLIGKLTLPAYIQQGMSESEIANINDSLQNQGITIQF